MAFQFGKQFKITIFGASHDVTVGIAMEGLPLGWEVPLHRMEEELRRRRPHTSKETSRQEPDQLLLLSGLQDGKTTPSPLVIALENNQVKKEEYQTIERAFRPGHGDYTAHVKYGKGAWKTGGGIASGRMTATLVVAGAMAMDLLEKKGIMISSTILFGKNHCGAQIEVRGKNIPAGLGRPFFDSLESQLSHLYFSVPSVKGVVFGNIMKTYEMTGIEALDPYVPRGEGVGTENNHDGGIQGGITNGEDVVVHIYLKPIATQSTPVPTLNRELEPVTLSVRGRHDSSIAERVRPVLESCMAIVVLDEMLQESLL
ncbi:MAG: chorismate synthase [Tissierellia bacterium]|nr:chorismate synthase [Tissierellia bacterium]